MRQEFSRLAGIHRESVSLHFFISTTVDINLANHRFVDHNMIMRYHWGLAIGHTYMHGYLQVSTSGSSERVSHREDEDMDDADGHTTIAENEEEATFVTDLENDEDAGSVTISENEERTDDECSDDSYEGMSDFSDKDESDDDDDDEHLALDEMYGEGADVEYYD